MKHAETVTFGGGCLDRSAELRGQADVIAGHLNGAKAKIFPLWRGRVLVSGTPAVRSVSLPVTHDLFQYGQDAPVFLGFDGEYSCFAIDISSWVPDDFDADSFSKFHDTTVYTHPDVPDGAGFWELRSVMTQLSATDAEVLATAKALFSWHESHQFCAKCGTKSVMAESGWQRNCPSCKTPHFPRTDPVVIMLITHGNDVLIGRSPGWPEGMYSLLAGFVEPGETLEAAVRREVYEEAGITVGPVSYLASQPWAFPSSLMFGCAGEATSRDIKIDPSEIEDARWISREEMAKAMRGEHPEILPAREGAIAHFILFHWLSDTLK
ncbi:NAD(+) diphosphatase [Thalassobius sp. I31.1]|uniref:NAD(+) diphosphatase n=1 Tax=Thalassobius sp. I31.1 TaxID=2109912 RepID=UPI000D1B15FB|nr:NAD(+) diphosphatase [Thalassobius sp. I31.1]